MTIRPRRSVLYMPGSNARALEKARSLPADALILDLEDAVAPEAKEAARGQVCAAIAAGGYGRREVVIRINGLDTPWGQADLQAAAHAMRAAGCQRCCACAALAITRRASAAKPPRSIKPELSPCRRARCATPDPCCR